MSVEIIYEKKYPRIDPMEEMKQIELEMADEPEEPTPSFEEIMQKIQENTTYVLTVSYTHLTLPTTSRV